MSESDSTIIQVRELLAQKRLMVAELRQERQACLTRIIDIDRALATLDERVFEGWGGKNQSVIDFVTANPGVTSREIGIATGCATVPSTLYIQKRLRREKNSVGVWIYFPVSATTDG